jgi:micrococcal nuclease
MELRAILVLGLAVLLFAAPIDAAATQVMLELVQGRTLRCELDGERTHDRCAGICYLDGADVSEVMVQRGVARDCPRFSQGRYAEAKSRPRLADRRSG